MSDVLRVGNCSGFYGDRLSAMREMLEGASAGHRLDVLTGDYLAELTMLILGKDRLRDPSLGYARTFVRQVEDCLGLALERGVRIVSNAGGLNPAGLADKLHEVARGLGLDPGVAHVEGDNLISRAAELDLGDALTANAYLGGFGIAEALSAGADVVVTGRVTDASLVVGAAASHFGWGSADLDQLAGAVVAGHVIECGTQATGGNFSGFLDLPQTSRPLGFPVAEISSDGSFVVTKHDDTGGAVTVDTVTAQLVYEIQSQAYLGPDVTTRLDAVQLSQAGPDRVRVAGVRGEAPPEQLKVCVNELGGYRNQMEFVLVGLDIEEKAAWVRAQLTDRLAARPPAAVVWDLVRTDRPDAPTEEQASARLRVTVKDPDPDLVGKTFSAAAVELALASYPGFTLTTLPGPASPYGIYRAAYVPRSAVEHLVVLPDGSRRTVPDPAVWSPTAGFSGRDLQFVTNEGGSDDYSGTATSMPLGTFVHARSGDKGGDANVGLWVGADEDTARREARVRWLLATVTPDAVRRWVPEAADLEVEVFPLPNLGAVNVLLHGLLGEGVASSTRFDPQAKALGEWIRSRHVELPVALR